MRDVRSGKIPKRFTKSRQFRGKQAPGGGLQMVRAARSKKRPPVEKALPAWSEVKDLILD